MLRFLATLLLVPLLAAYGRGSWLALHAVCRHPEPLRPLALGAAVFLGVWLLLLRRRESIWETVEHEMTHALFCVLLFKKIHVIQASTRRDAEGRSGFVTYDAGGGLRTALITLAPYFFPTLSLALLLLRPLLQGGYRPGLDVLIGATLAWHAVTQVRAFGLHQPDIRQNGILFSVLFLALANLICWTAILVGLDGGYPAVRRYLVDAPAWLAHVAHAPAWLARLGPVARLPRALSR